jgi:hypothetical protein
MTEVFKAGQLIKKVRGTSCLGTVAKFGRYEVVEFSDGTVDDCLVYPVHNWTSTTGFPHQAGTQAITLSSLWEPVCKDDDQVGSWDALRDLGLDVETVMGVTA